jgi:hypothetical protein
MDASATIRLEGLILTDQDGKTSRPSGASSIQEEISDEALMNEVCLEGREAMAILFRRHSRAVRGISYRVLRDAS